MRLLFVTLGVLALTVAGATAAPRASHAAKPAAQATFVLTGHGWGHGVGMSQCGAMGFAKQGWSATRIVKNYYRNTQLQNAAAGRVRVLLADKRPSVRISSKSAFKVKDADGETYPLTAPVELKSSLKVKVDADKPARALPGPLTFLPGRSALVLDKPYRGQLVIKAAAGGLRVVNSVGVEQYLYGVVPLEIGYAGPAEALKAQAIAARTYVISSRGSGDFDVYPDTRSQVYGGAAAEKSATNEAVDTTAGQVLTYKGKPIRAYYSASSGGRTAAVQDAWPDSKPIPYLVSVDDPYDDVCSVHSWGPYVYSSRGLARKLGLGARLLDARTVVNPSKRVTTLEAQTAAGVSSLTGAAVRKRMGLRSTWFRIGVLSLGRPAGTPAFGSAVTLTGVARGVGPARLDQRAPGAQWSTVARVKPAGDGTFSVRVKVKRTADYRVRAAKVASAVVRVPVAMGIRLEANDLGELVGRVRPAVAEARVDVQRQSSGGWRTVESLRTDGGGEFVVTPSGAGSYRARVAARAGFTAGVSSTVQIEA
jgi:SpoIID/LytB domain protein